MSRRRHLGLALVVWALVASLTALPAQAATKAPPTKALPAELDVYVPYQGQTVCDPVARPGVTAFARLMTSYYGMGSVSLTGRTCVSGSQSEHYDGRAWDWMLNVNNASQEAVAQSVLAWLTAPDKNGVKGAMARRFGIMYMIHNGKMWRSYATERGWAPYSGSNPHTDHIHFSFNYDGAAGRTSWWTGVATTSYLTYLVPSNSPFPPPVSKPVPVPLEYGMESEAVRQLQVRLGGIPTTGYYGQTTQDRVAQYQAYMGLPVTGTADLTTQAVLVARGWSRAVKDYSTSAATQAKIAEKLTSLPAPVTPQVRSTTPTPSTPASTTPTPTQTTPTPTPTQTTPTPTPSGTTTLSYGMSSPAVTTLQNRLGNVRPTGYFGDTTKARVIEYQKWVGLGQTGVADPTTQQVLASRGWAAYPGAYIYPTDWNRGFLYLECADFVAWKLGLTWRMFGFPNGRGGAVDWKQYAGNVGRVATNTPSVGDIAWWARGHVALVTRVASDGTVSIEEFNGLKYHQYSTRSGVRADSYLHKVR